MTSRMILYVRLLFLGLLLVGFGTWLLVTETGAATATIYFGNGGVINYVDDATIHDWTVLGVVLLLAVMAIPFLVWSDARRKGFSRRAALLWAAASFLFFPFGPVLYLLLRQGEAQLPERG